MWIREEYARPLAVLFAWLSALVPWNVTYSTGIAGGSVLFLRFPLLQVRFVSGIPEARGVLALDVLSAIRFQAGTSLELAYGVWAVGGAVVAVCLLVSVALYAEIVEAWPVDPARLVGGLLGLAAVVLTAATYLVWARGLPGVPIPVGVAVLYAFAAVLVFAERR